jgi:hypothetical protein
MWSKLRNIIYILHWSSADVCLGVAGLALCLWQHIATKPPLAWLFILPITVWIIYFLDHWLDSKENGHIISPRHAFIHQNRKIFVVFASLLALTNGILLAIFFSLSQISYATWVVLPCLFYFLCTYFKVKWFTKELFAALIYALGICFLPFYVNLHESSSMHFIHYFGMLVFLIALINLLQIALIEAKTDTIHKQQNTANIIGLKSTKMFLAILYPLALFTLYTAPFTWGLTAGFTACIVLHSIFYTHMAYTTYRIISEWSFLAVWIIFRVIQ